MILTNLSQLMTAKLNEPILHIQDWIEGWIRIAVARSDLRMIRVALIISTLQDWQLDWDPASGLRLTH